MATCINSSPSCLPPFYAIPIFPLSFTCIYIYMYIVGQVHILHMRMREIISRKMVQRSPFWLSRQRFASERQQGVNTTGRFAELATNVEHSSSIQ